MTAEQWVILRRRIRSQHFAIPGLSAERPPITASARVEGTGRREARARFVGWSERMRASSAAPSTIRSRPDAP